MTDFAHTVDEARQRLSWQYAGLHATTYMDSQEGKPYNLPKNELRARHGILLSMEVVQNFNPLLGEGNTETAAQYRATVLAALEMLNPRNIKHFGTESGKEYAYKINNDSLLLEGIEIIKQLTLDIENRTPFMGYSLPDRIKLASAELDPSAGAMVKAVLHARESQANRDADGQSPSR